MALFHITIEKVIVEKDDDRQIKRLLLKILEKLESNQEDEQLKAEIMRKLNVIIDDVKSTI